MHLFPLFAGIAWNPGIRGILVVVVGVSVLCGSIYLLLATNTGARLGMLLALAGLFGWLVCLTLFWWISPPAIGPRGNNPVWKPVEVYVNGTDAPKTEVVAKLPQPQDLPSTSKILAENPSLAKDFPNGFGLSDLKGADPALAQQSLDSVQLNGWRLVPASSAGEAQAAADAALVASGTFKAVTDYKKLDTFDYGGKPTRQEYCADAKGGYFLPDDAWCRVQYKISKLVNFKHPTHYAVVQVQAVIPQTAKPGEAPPVPQVDPNSPVISVVMIRDLGDVRLIPFLYFVISLSLFIFFVLVLHYRDKTLTKNLEAARAAKAS